MINANTMLKTKHEKAHQQFVVSDCFYSFLFSLVVSSFFFQRRDIKTNQHPQTYNGYDGFFKCDI